VLVLARKALETIVIDGTIEVTVVKISPYQVRLGITAPRHITVNRKEVEALVQAKKQGRPQDAALAKNG
jgi:carbon storage regulator